MQTTEEPLLRSEHNTGRAPAGCVTSPCAILSFDVEEHYRIEAAAGLAVDRALKAQYRERLEPSTRWLIDRLAERDICATFFVVGKIARDNPALVRAIHDAGHEVASHGWEHKRVHNFTPAAFREDLLRSKDALEQVTGEAVVGYRAPTFSVVASTAWAIDVLEQAGMLYDSSIYPVRHDRYGVPLAPRSPFVARGVSGEILELPPATLRFLGFNAPLGGGGYFRLLPLIWMERAIAQTHRQCVPPVATLYFHPWEFDAEQPRLPLRRLNRFRTYVGIGRSRARLTTLLARHRFSRAIDVARSLLPQCHQLPQYLLAAQS